MPSYSDFHRRSVDEPEAFWAEQAKLIDWQMPPKRVLDASRRPSSTGSPAAPPTSATTPSTATCSRAAIKRR